MKIRPIEKNIYNFIKERKYVPFKLIAEKFGQGDVILKSIIMPYSVVGIGSPEVRQAIINLIENFGIYEIACGPKFVQLLGGGKLSDQNGSDLPIMRVDTENQSIVLDKPFWLPIVYCSEEGALEIAKALYGFIYKHEPEKFSSILTNLNRIFNGESNDAKYWSICDLSYELTENYREAWDYIIQDILFKIDPITNERMYMFRPIWSFKTSICYMGKDGIFLLLEKSGNRFLMLMNKMVSVGFYKEDNETLILRNEVKDVKLTYHKDEDSIVTLGGDINHKINPKIHKFPRELKNYFNQFDSIGFEELFIRYYYKNEI